MNILFFKKFGGNSERERIIIFVMESFDKMDWCNQDKYLFGQDKNYIEKVIQKRYFIIYLKRI